MTRGMDKNEHFIDRWLQSVAPDTHAPDVRICLELPKVREQTLADLAEVVKEHFIGAKTLKIWERLPNCANLVENKLPTSKRIQSGDLGEIIATEYATAKTTFKVPIKRLRWKDDRNTSMRGDDAIGYKVEDARVRVLKVESKSRANLTPSTVTEANEELLRNDGRPNPSTLAFIASRLREDDRDDEAMLFERLQTGEAGTYLVEHMLFTLSGNNPKTALGTKLTTTKRVSRRHLVGVVVVDHQDFIQAVFSKANA